MSCSCKLLSVSRSRCFKKFLCLVAFVPVTVRPFTAFSALGFQPNSHGCRERQNVAGPPAQPSADAGDAPHAMQDDREGARRGDALPGLEGEARARGVECPRGFEGGLGWSSVL